MRVSIHDESNQSNPNWQPLLFSSRKMNALLAFPLQQELIPELMEAGSGALLDELDAIIPHISGGSASVEDFVAKKKAVAVAHQDNPGHVEARSCGNDVLICNKSVEEKTVQVGRISGGDPLEYLHA